MECRRKRCRKGGFRVTAAPAGRQVTPDSRSDAAGTSVRCFQNTRQMFPEPSSSVARFCNAAWETAGVDPNRLDPILLEMEHPRAAMKEKYLGDIFPASAFAAPRVLFRDCFATDRNGVKKGAMLVDLGSLP